ncbi:M15 family metallopeptidase [Vibrio fluvialis]|uniref:M15 family metallopeptidase n=1 Tax=Vibrio fluvialis TaxID=676 RepID=UPI003D7EC56E|nr:M15 family metallopeptidase [Vibrio fluvialis]
MMTPEQLTGQTTSHLVEVMVGQKAFLVHSQVSADLLALKQAADEAGFVFNIASGFRPFERQLAIWNRKMSGDTAILDINSQPLDTSLWSEADKVHAILRWSALPGGSRHHWGTDFDVFDRSALPPGEALQLEPWEYLEAHQRPFYQWLKTNLARFGFFFPYREKGSGVAFEPWHISHRIVSEQCLQALTLPVLAQQLASAPILGKQCVQQDLGQIYTQYITQISGGESV